MGPRSKCPDAVVHIPVRLALSGQAGWGNIDNIPIIFNRQWKVIVDKTRVPTSTEINESVSFFFLKYFYVLFCVRNNEFVFIRTVSYLLIFTKLDIRERQQLIVQQT